MLEFSKLLKIIKECNNLLDKKKFNSKIIDLQFSKIKSPNEKKINYSRFLELIANLAAIKILNVDSVLIGAYSGIMDPGSPEYGFKHLTVLGKLTKSAQNEMKN